MVDVNERLSTKVDKVTCNLLSTEDFSSAEKDKLANIQAGATYNQNDSYLLAREHHTGTQGGPVRITHCMSTDIQVVKLYN